MIPFYKHLLLTLRFEFRNSDILIIKNETKKYKNLKNIMQLLYLNCFLLPRKRLFILFKSDSKLKETIKLEILILIFYLAFLTSRFLNSRR